MADAWIVWLQSRFNNSRNVAELESAGAESAHHIPCGCPLHPLLGPFQLTFFAKTRHTTKRYSPVKAPLMRSARVVVLVLAYFPFCLAPHPPQPKLIIQ